MTLVKKTKKPKAKKAGPRGAGSMVSKKKPVKKPVKKTVFSGAKGSARIEKIDRRLRPTPEPKLVKIDPLLKNPLKIVDVPRSQLIPSSVQMFSGQDAGNLNRQLDILASKEQQLEGKVTQLQKQNLYEQIIGKMSIIDSNLNILDGNYDIKEYNILKKQLKEINRLIPKDEPSLFDFYDNLYNKLENIKNENKMNAFVSDEDLALLEEPSLVQVKSTNTLLDDKIHNNNLVDEAQIIIDEIKNKEVKAPVNLPSFEAIELLNEMKSTNVKGPIILPTLEEAQTIIKKPRGRPKKNAPKIDELVEVKSTNTLLDDKIIDNILDDVSATVGEPIKIHYNFITGMSEKVIIPKNEDDYEYSIGTGKYTLKSQSPNYYLDEKTGNYEPKSENRKYEFVILGGEPQYKLREHYVDPSTYRNIPSTFNKSESRGLLD